MTPDDAEPETIADVAYVGPPAVVATIATDDAEVVAAIPSVPPIAETIAEVGRTIAARVDALHAAFDREVRAEATREKVVDRLHAELQEYKNDLLLNLLRPIFVDLIGLHDDVGKILATLPEADESTPRLSGHLAAFRQGVEDILYRQGVEPFESAGDAFDPRRQRAFGTQPTDDPALNKHVAARLRKGFLSGEKVIRPEIVSVFAHKPPPAGD